MITRRRTARARLGDEGGMTLLEMMAALFILALTMTALLSASLTSIRSLDLSKHRQDASQLASSILESTRGMPFEQVATTSSNDPEFEGEDVVLYQYGALDHETTSQDLTATTWVTEVAGTTEQRRVTVEVTWDDRGKPRELRQSTVVAEARRGLPAPAFAISPSPANGSFATSETETCVGHTLTNLGEQDKYSWEIAAATPLPGLIDHDGDASTPGVDGFRTATSPTWDVWVEIDGVPMYEDTGDSLPDAVAFVPRNGAAELAICYRPASTPPDGPVTFTHTFRSAFDSNVSETIEDVVTVSSTLYRLYLHHPRKNNGTVDTNATSLLMNQTEPTATEGTINYDPPGGGSPDTRSGLRVLTNGSVVFDYQFQQRAAIDQSVILELSAAHPDASSTAPKRLNYELVLERRSVDGTTNLATINSSIDVTRPTDSADWDDIVHTFSLPADEADRTFEQNDYLRLRFTCAGPTTCHIHYDVTPNHLSRITTEVYPRS
jgi:Tfp pilus assembly protein PilV